MKLEERIIFGDRGRVPAVGLGGVSLTRRKDYQYYAPRLSFAANSGSDPRKVLVGQNPQTYLNHIRSKGRAFEDSGARLKRKRQGCESGCAMGCEPLVLLCL
jgi:hypothetical protein